MADPLLQDSEVADWLGQTRSNQGVTVANTTLEPPSPDEAAKNVALANVTRLPYEAVKTDPVSIQNQALREANVALLKKNPDLAAWVGTTPGAYDIAHDDLEQLSKAGIAFGKLDKDPFAEGWRTFSNTLKEGDTLGQIGRGAVKAGSILVNPLGHIDDLTDTHLLSELLSPFGQLMSAAIEGGAAALATPFENIGMPNAAKELKGMVEWGVMRGDINLIHAPELEAPIKDVIRHGLPYALAGERVPPGIHPIIDEVKKEQAKTDGKALKEVIQEAGKSATLERSPEAFETFAEQTASGRTIGIPAKLVREIYANEEPLPNDGAFGWVPDIAAQLKAAESYGGDIDVPVSKYVTWAKENPDLEKQIHDFVRVREDGFSVEEAKEAEPKEFEQPVSTVEDLARKEAALAPMVESGQTARLKKLRVETPEDVIVRGGTAGDAPFTDYEIIGDRGVVGTITTQLSPKGLIYVENIEGFRPKKGPESKLPPPNMFGLNQIRMLARELIKEYPTATHIGGYRISGARAKAPGVGGAIDATGWVEMPLKRLLASEESVKAFAEDIGWTPITSKSFIPEGTEVNKTVDIGEGKTATILNSFKARDLLEDTDLSHLKGPSRFLSSFFRGKLEELVGDVDTHIISREDMDKFTTVHERTNVPGFYDGPTHSIILNKDFMSGAYSPGAVAHVVIHEAAHAATLREMNIDPRLKIKVEALLEHTKVSLEQFSPKLAKELSYGFKNADEFIAEAFSNPRFQEALVTTPLPKELAEVFNLSKDTKTVWDVVRNFVADILEKLLGERPSETVMDAVLKLGEEFEKRAKLTEDELYSDMYEGALAPDQHLLDNAKAQGMAKDRFRNYQKLIAERNEADAARQLEKFEKLERQKQTAEWKAEEKVVRKEVDEAVRQRPDIASDNFMRNGPLGKIKLDSTSLTEEQKASLPRDYYGVGGINPDAIAGHFGYDSGEVLVARLASLIGVRKGLGLTPGEYVKGLVDKQVEAEMASRFGDKDVNILHAARDAVRTPGDMERLSEELMAAYQNAGHDPTQYSWKQHQAAIREYFNGLPAKQAKDVMRYVRASGREGDKALIAREKGDFEGTLIAKQNQVSAEIMVREAQKFAKTSDQLDKLVKGYAKAKGERSGVEQEYTDQVHGILSQLGVPLKRAQAEVQKALAKREPLEEWIRKINDPSGHNQQSMPVASFLWDKSDPAFGKPIDKLSVEETRGLKDSLKAIDENGRAVKKWDDAGEKRDFDATLTELEQDLERFGLVPQHVIQREKGVIGEVGKHFSRQVTVENSLDHMAKENPLGIWNRLFANKMTDGSRHELELNKQFANRIAGIKYKGNVDELVSNPLLKHGATGQPLIMNRGNLLELLKYFGSPSSFDKLVRGFDVEPEAMRAWVKQAAKKEDWEYVRAIGNVWKDIKKLSDDLNERQSKVPAADLPIWDVDTGHSEVGVVPGWYNNISYDRNQPGKSKQLMGKLWDENNSNTAWRASTPHSWEKERTNYTQAVNLNPGASIIRMQQVLHDIAMREAVSDIGKFVYNDRFQNALIRHMGPTFRDKMVNWLEQKANPGAYDGKNASNMDYIDSFMRKNALNLFIAFNWGTPLKHGPTAWMNSMVQLGGKDPAKGASRFITAVKNQSKPSPYDPTMTNYEFRMKHSKEMPLRDMFWEDNFGGAVGASLVSKVDRLDKFREAIRYYGSKPVAFSDKISAGPMWDASYAKWRDEGLLHSEAVTAADNDVVKAHGSITNKPLVMGDIPKMFTMFYGFWNNQLQRAVRLGWHASDAWQDGRANGIQAGAKHVPQLAAEMFAITVFPALIEQWASPLEQPKGESPWWHWTKIMSRPLWGMFPIIRDVGEAVVRGTDPTVGMLGSLFKPGTDVLRDIEGEFKGKNKIPNLMKDGAAAIGAMTGTFPLQIAHEVELGARVAQGDRPHKGITGAKFDTPSTWLPVITGQNEDTWLYGLRHGKFREKK